MNPISTPFLTAADEAFAQRLEANEDDAWRRLLTSVPPVFNNNPVAEQIADLLVMKSNASHPQEIGKLIRQMLFTKATLSEERPEDDGSTNTVSSEDDDESVEEDDDGRWPVDPEQDYGGDLPDPDYDEEDWGTAGGPPLPGRRLIDGEWKLVPYAEWTDEDKALADEIYGNDSEDEEERTYEEWLAKRDKWLRKQSKETLIKMVLMDDMVKEDYIERHMDMDDEAE